MESAAMNLLVAISRFTAQAFVSGLWQGLLLISAVWVGLRLLSRASASARFAIWGFAFALAVALPLLHLRAAAVQGGVARSAVVHVGAAWGFAIAGVWAVLMGIRAVQLGLQAVHLRRIWRRAVPVAVEGATLAILESGRRSAKLCTSGDVDAPSVIGFFSPRLLVPDWLFAKLTEPELRQIVLHECEHLRRGDDWMNLLQKVGLALFPLNPALLWVDRRLSLERELACDAGVVASTAAPFDYAHCLTRLAEHRMGCRRVALSLSAWSRQSELVRRVHSLLRPIGAMSPMQARVSVALLSVGLAGGAVEMARVPRLVSFTDATAAPVRATARPAAMQVVPVVYRAEAPSNAGAPPHATLLKAVLPSSASKPPRMLRATKSRLKQMPQAQFRSVRTEVRLQEPREVLTAAREPITKSKNHPLNRNAAGPVYTLSVQFPPSYAAVPFGDGWLIVQL